MNEKPILFSTPEVQAILAGRKTQARRVIKPQPENEVACDCEGVYAEIFGGGVIVLKPRYNTGDILWVRESFCPNYFDDYSPAYKTDYDKDKIGDVVPEPKWKPSIHMPRAAARIFLRVTGVRAERVQDINIDDVISEGIESVFVEGSPNFREYEDYLYACDEATVDKYHELWNSLNAKRGYSWESNPWVWVYEFERMENYATNS